MVHGHSGRRLSVGTLRQALKTMTWVGVLALAASVPACGFLAGATERQQGKSVGAQYRGLDKKSVAIVVYADSATVFEYPGVREEVSAFLAKQFHQHMPEVRLLNYRDVIRWQDNTLNWTSLPEKDIGKHFGVDRVLYVEVLDYRTREPGVSDLLRGRMKGTAKVFEVDAPGVTPAWKETFDTYWPERTPQPAPAGDDRAVRIRILDLFTTHVVYSFYDHHEVDPSVREKAM